MRRIWSTTRLGIRTITLFCDDLPSCTGNENEKIEMYGDDTALYCIGNAIHQVVVQ